MQMAIDGNNSFHTGWLARFLGLPRFLPGAAAMKAGDVRAFEDGWDTCQETPEDARAAAFYRMKSERQAYSGWIDDAGEDVDLPPTAKE